MRTTELIGPAVEHTKRLLFRPFNIGTWFSFGFIFALQSCVEGGGSGFNFPGGGGGGGGGGGSTRSQPSGGTGDTADSVSDILHRLGGSLHHSNGDYDPFAHIDTGLIVAIAVGSLLLIIPMVILAYWLGSRGQMMSIRAVALGRSDVGEAWNATGPMAKRLFNFHLAMAGLGCLAFLPLLGIGAAVSLPAIKSGGVDSLGSIMPALVLLGLVALLLLVPFGIVSGMARNFVAPLMFKYDMGARDAWKMFWGAAKGHVGQLFVFFLLRGVFAAVASVATLMVGMFTCCLGFLPVVHQALLAPYYVFERAWGLSVLASLGPDFDLTQGGTWGMSSGPTPPFGGGYGQPGQGPGPSGFAPQGYGPGPVPPAGGFGGPPAY